MNNYTIKINDFEGPFDLLFHLIEKNKVDIYDIPISLITDQYLTFIAQMEELDLDIASEFLVMASTLLYIKSRLLLPPPVREGGEEEAADPRDELIISIIEYKKYKEFTAALREQSAYWGGCGYRDAGIVDEELSELVRAAHIEWTAKTAVYDMDRNRLMDIYRRLILEKQRKHDEVGSRVSKIVEREQVPLARKISEIINYLTIRPRFMFQKLYNPNKVSRKSIVTAFMAVLELASKGQLLIKQDKLFGSLFVLRKKGIKAESGIQQV